MNSDTVSLVHRPYQQVVDDVLTAIAGGVVNEPSIYDVGADRYPLAQRARDLRSVTGTVAQRAYTFRKDVDFAFDEGRNSVAWLPGGVAPDDGTTFFTDYFLPEGSSPLTDLNVGSVTRTLSESFARETATVYAEIDEAYRAGFVDTATGTSLELVVSILGVTRKTKDFALGLVTFFRDPGIEGNVTIPEGTVLRTTKGTAEFESAEPRTLQRGQARIDVPVRAGEAFRGEAGQVGAGEISVLAQSVAGVARVTNLDPTVLGAKDETDEELRLRAKAAIRGAGKATLNAIARAIADERATLVDARDPDGVAGRVALFVDAQPSQLPGVRVAVHDTRAAGVAATVLGRYVYVTPRVLGAVDAALTPAGKQRAVRDVVDAVQGYVDGLESGQPLTGEDLLASLQKVRDVAGLKVVELLAATADLTGPGDTELVDLLLAATQATTDQAALREEFAGILAEATAPTGQLTWAPELVVGASGAPATDADLEAGTFQVLATVGGQPWWIALRMAPDDVLLLPAAGG